MIKSIKKYFKNKFDNRVNSLIEKYLKNKFNLHSTIEYKKIFEKGYYSLMWDNAIKLKEERLIRQFEDNVEIYCYTDSVLCKLIYTDIFEEAELDFVKRYLKKGDIFVDIGTNIGLFSVYAANRVGETGKVISFEPTKKTYERLLENIKLNNLQNIKAYQLAVSEKNEQLEFTMSLDGYDAWNSLAKPTQGQSLEKIIVDCVQIDKISMIDSDFVNATLIKIDIEGWELFALKGGYNFFSQPDAPTLLIEFTEQNAINAGTSCKELYNYLNILGYLVYKYDQNEVKLVLEPLKDIYPYENLIATKFPEKVLNRLRNI